MEAVSITTRSISGEEAAAILSLPLIEVARRAIVFRENDAVVRLRPPKRARRGVATLDYMLVIAVVLPLAAFLMWAGPRMMNLVYETTAVLISWPFL